MGTMSRHFIGALAIHELGKKNAGFCVNDAAVRRSSAAAAQIINHHAAVGIPHYLINELVNVTMALQPAHRPLAEQHNRF